MQLREAIGVVIGILFVGLILNLTSNCSLFITLCSIVGIFSILYLFIKSLIVILEWLNDEMGDE